MNDDSWTPPSPRMFRTINRVIRPLLDSPLHPLLSNRLMLLEYTGRRTGRLITVPIGYFPWGDDEVLATSTLPRWVVNLQESPPVRLRLRGRWVEATPTVLTGLDDRVALLGEMGGRWGPKALAGLRLGLPADRTATPDELRTAASRCHLARFRLRG